jgi:hypothetical protein
VAEIVKHIGRRPFVQRVLAWLAAGLIGLVKRTTRWQTVNGAVATPAWDGATPVIVTFWHNRLAMMPYCWPSRAPFHMLISSHPDGRLIANTVAHFGITAVAGSTRRGGSEALRTLIRLAKDGASVGITPDGPRGPRMRAGQGAVVLAGLTGVPILPAAVSVSRRMVLGTWDKLIVALPFGHGAMVWGEPIVVPREATQADVMALTLRLEAELNRVSAEADAIVGHAPIEPEPLSRDDTDAAA